MGGWVWCGGCGVCGVCMVCVWCVWCVCGLKLGLYQFKHGLPTPRAFRTYIVCSSHNVNTGKKI